MYIFLPTSIITPLPPCCGSQLPQRTYINIFIGSIIFFKSFAPHVGYDDAPMGVRLFCVGLLCLVVMCGTIETFAEIEINLIWRQIYFTYKHVWNCVEYNFTNGISSFFHSIPFLHAEKISPVRESNLWPDKLTLWGIPTTLRDQPSHKGKI